jgi:hypothetical protein
VFVRRGVAAAARVAAASAVTASDTARERLATLTPPRA